MKAEPEAAGTCEVGQTAAQTGCTPASGGGGKKPAGGEARPSQRLGLDLARYAHKKPGLYAAVVETKLRQQMAGAPKGEVDRAAAEVAREAIREWEEAFGKTAGGGPPPAGPGGMRPGLLANRPPPPTPPQIQPPAAPASEAARDWKEKGVRSQAFKGWFGDWEKDPTHSSQVVEGGTGEPQKNHEMKVVYHGTLADFRAFDPKKVLAGAVVGAGFYFAENKEIADFYAGRAGPGKGKVLQCYLNIRRPFDFNATFSYDRVKALAALAGGKRGEVLDVMLEAGEEVDGMDLWTALAEAVGHRTVNRLLGRAGYDGIVHLSRDDRGTPLPADEAGKNFGRVWIAFRPEQIKSTDNVGTFDPTTADFGKALPPKRGWGVEYD